MRSYLARLRHRIYLRPVLLFVILWAIVGLLDFVSEITSFDLVVSIPIADLPDFIEIWVVLVLMAGGLFLMLSLLPFADLSYQWLFEKLTWISTGCGWLCYTVSLMATSTKAITVWGGMIVLMIICCINLWKIHVEESTVRKQVL